MNTLGRRLRVSIVGESHGPGVGALVDGVPPGLPVDDDVVAARMAQRRPGGPLATQRREDDRVTWLAGVHAGRTTGAPVLAWIWNQDARSSDYGEPVARPGHADAVEHAWSRGHRDPRGSGHRSGRLTAPLVAAAALVEPLLSSAGVRVGAHLASVAGRVVQETAWPDPVEPPPAAQMQAVAHAVPPTLGDGAAMAAAIEQARAAGDSLGGTIAWRADGVPPLLGDPWADGVPAVLAASLFTVPALRAVTFGAGPAAARMFGSEHNDAPVVDGVARSVQNHAGGISGGRTTGAPLWGHVAVKPTASIARAQQSVHLDTGGPVTVATRGRHDPCIAVRAVPVVRACVELALTDLLLLGVQQGHVAPWTRKA